MSSYLKMRVCISQLWFCYCYYYDFISCNCDIIFHNCNYYEVTSYLKMWICISVVILFLVITTLYLTMWLYFSNATLFLGINFVFNYCDFCFSQIPTVSHSVTLFCFSYFILHLTITFFLLWGGTRLLYIMCHFFYYLPFYWCR